MRKLKLFLSLLMVMLLSVGNVWATSPATITFADEGLENGVQYTDPFDIDDGNVTITFGGGGNDGKYYNTGTGIRTYSNGTITIAGGENVTITAIGFTFSGTCTGTFSASTGTYSSPNWTGSASSIVFTNTASSGHSRLQAISVTYTVSSGGGDQGGGGSGSGSETAGTGTITFGSGEGKTSVSSASASGDDSRGKNWTITTVGTTSFTPASSQIGSKNNPATSITFSTTLNETMSITAFSASFGGFSGTAGTVTLKVGNTTVGTGSLDGTNDVTVGATNTTTSGTVLTVEVTGISKGVKVYSISYTVAAASTPDPGTPTVESIAITNNPTKTTYYSEEAYDLSGMVVEATMSDASVVTVDNNNLILSAIDKSVNKLNTTQPITVTYSGKSTTFDITLIPYTPAGACALIPNTNNTKNAIFTEGVVTRKDANDWNPSYGNIIYWISEDGKQLNELEVYRGKSFNGEDFASLDDLKQGDKVIVYGNLSNYKGTKEYAQDSRLISHTPRALSSIAISGNLTETSYNLNATELNYAGLTVKATYQTGYEGDVTDDVEWSIEPATLSTAGDEIAVTITASYTENNVNRTASKNVIVSVSDKVLTSITIPDNYSANIYCGQEIPKPTVTAHFDDLSTSDVTEASTLSEVDILTPGVYNVTVSYTYGDVTKTAEFELTLNAYSVADVQNVIPATGEISTAVEGVIRWIGYVNANGFAKYSISATGSKDDSDTLLIYNSYAGKDINGYINFENTNDIEVGDKVIVSDKFTTYSGTKETKTKESYISSLTKKSLSSLAISGSLTTTVYELNDDIDVDGLVVTGTYNTGYEQDVTAGVTWTSDPEHLSTAGESVSVHLTATIGTVSDETDVTVKVTAPAQKYAITFDGNGADGGNAPDAIADKAAGAEVTLPANTYTYTGHNFTGWKVYDENEDEVTVTAGAFEMPASDVTIKAQWEEISSWAYVYTSNVAIESNEEKQVTIGGNDYDAAKTNKGTSATITLPQGVTTIHLHLVAWKGEAQTVTVSGACFNEDKELTIHANDAVAGTVAKYDLGASGVDYYFSLTPDNAVAANEVITITAASNKRFVLFGVNQEGGVLPVLESIEISGDLSTKAGYKVGDALDLDGLTVNAIYSLGGVAQTPVDITNDPELVLTYDPLVENQTEVTITATYKGQIDDITITGLDPVASADPLIYVSKLNVNFASVEVGDAVPAAETVTVTLTNVASVTATLGGTNADAFSVSPASLTESGDITISILANTDAAASYSATLTISDGEGGADDKTINLSFAVTEPVAEDDVTGTWTLVTNATQLAAGKKVIIAQYVDADGAINTMAGQSTNNRSVIASTVAGTTLTPAVGTKVMTLVDAGEGNFYLKTSDGEYLYNASTSSKSYLRTKAEEENVSWTIAVDAEGVATITSVENTNRTKMRYNPNTSGSPLFNCYASGQEDIALYMLEEDTPEPQYTVVRTGLTAGWYYTMCLDKAVTAVQGGTIWKVVSKAENDKDVILEDVEGTLDAGRPYIFLATASTLEVAYTGAAVAAPLTEGNNGLIGSFTQELIAQSTTNYIIYNNALYYVNSEAYVGAHRAYLDMTGVPAFDNGSTPAPGRRRINMSVYGEQTATGVDAINATEAPVKMMINGQMYILRGEKMYDATGRLVK